MTSGAFKAEKHHKLTGNHVREGIGDDELRQPLIHGSDDSADSTDARWEDFGLQ